MPTKATSVLVVDDDFRIRRLLSALLAQSGYLVLTANDGFSALAEIRNQVPDVLLSDLNMPGMTGFELLSVVRRRFPTVHAIAMSSMFAGDGLPPGLVADAFYEKGTNPGRLLELLKAMSDAEVTPSLEHSMEPAPIWIPRNGHDPAGEPYVMISCPECLRTFPQTLNEDLRAIHETDCIFCLAVIHYAIVQPSWSATSKERKQPDRGVPSVPAGDETLRSSRAIWPFGAIVNALSFRLKSKEVPWRLRK
ncbi:MAG: response regulator [Acidobacteriaceae bacterium]